MAHLLLCLLVCVQSSSIASDQNLLDATPSSILADARQLETALQELVSVGDMEEISFVNVLKGSKATKNLPTPSDPAGKPKQQDLWGAASKVQEKQEPAPAPEDPAQDPPPPPKEKPEYLGFKYKGSTSMLKKHSPSKAMKAFGTAMLDHKADPANANPSAKPAKKPVAMKASAMKSSKVKKDGWQTKCSSAMQSAYSICRTIHDHVSGSCKQAIALCGTGEAWEGDSQGPKTEFKKGKKKMGSMASKFKSLFHAQTSIAYMQKLATYRRPKPPPTRPGEVPTIQTKEVKTFAESHETQMCVVMAKIMGVEPKDAPCNGLYQDGYITLGLNNNSFWTKNNVYKNVSVYSLKKPLILDCMDDSVADTVDCNDAKNSRATTEQMCYHDIKYCPPTVTAEFRMEPALPNGKGQLNKYTHQLWSLWLREEPLPPYFNTRVMVCNEAVMPDGQKVHMDNTYCDKDTEVFNLFLRGADKNVPARYKVQRKDLPWLPNLGDTKLDGNPKNDAHQAMMAANLKEFDPGMAKLAKIQNNLPTQAIHWSNLAPVPKSGTDSKVDENKWIPAVGEPKKKVPKINGDSPPANLLQYGAHINEGLMKPKPPAKAAPKPKPPAKKPLGAKTLSLEEEEEETTTEEIEQLHEDAQEIEELLK